MLRDFISSLKIVCVCVHVCVYEYECSAHGGQQRAPDSPAAVPSGGCELSGMDSGNRTWVLSKQGVLLTKRSELLQPFM